MEKITLIQPDDWHCHLRDENHLTRTVRDTASCFGRAMIMPNLLPPITEIEQAEAYRKRITNHIPNGYEFTPLMSLYLTEQMTSGTLRAAKASGFIIACKLYPAGATTHSSSGINRLVNIYRLMETLEEIDLPLMIHGESTDPTLDIFDREQYFIDQELIPLINHFPSLRIVLEHISTRYAVDFVNQGSEQLAATITAHHLWFNRNDLLSGGIHPHYYCMPVLKGQQDQKALIKAATSGHQKFFLGTDSAPHARSKKESCCGNAGIYSAYSAIELYAQIFDQENALNQLENFASINGANFYHMPLNTKRISLIKSSWKIPQELNFGDSTVVPMLGGNTLKWQQVNRELSP